MGSRPDCHRQRLQLGLLDMFDRPRLHIWSEHMLGPPCGMVLMNLPAAFDQPLHCQEPRLGVSLPSPNCYLLLALQSAACRYLLGICMARTSRAPADLYATTLEGRQKPRGRGGSWRPLLGAPRSCCLNWRLMWLETCSCCLNCRSAGRNDQILILLMRLEACPCGLNCRSATRSAHVLFWMWPLIAHLVNWLMYTDARKYLTLSMRAITSRKQQKRTCGKH